MNQKILKPILMLTIIGIFFGIMYLITKNIPLSIITGLISLVILK